MGKKELIDKFGLNYIECKAFSECHHTGMDIKYVIYYIMVKCHLKKSAVYSHYRKYLEKINDKNKLNPQ